MEIDKILDFVGKIYEEKINALLAAQETIHKENKPHHQSEHTNELFAALAKAQADMKTAGLDSENPYFKSRYADLATVVNASRPSLTKNGLSVIQQIITDKHGATFLNTILTHSSGQWIETNMRVLPPKNDIQTLGSHITYLRRYSYAALVGVVAADEDDDGEKSQAVHREEFKKGTALNHKYNPREEAVGVISKDQLAELEYELAEYPDIGEEIIDRMRLNSLADMPASKYRAAITRVREIKLARNESK
ncbi:MAG TPA: ERF family protein [Candidatus Babeliaceae bacterium]|nr:ERF family protein [Candidatus Babeliaceae bacterium]